MATPKASNAALFNAIYATCSPSFQSRIPKMDATNMQQVSMLITANNFQAEMNEWLTEAVNRIGMVLIREHALTNRLSKYVYGTMEFGDAIEELCVNIAKAEDYEAPANGSSIDPYRTTNPEVKALYHKVNSRRKYRVTTYPNQVKRAFLNEGGITSLFASITQSLVNASKVDDWLSIKDIFDHFLNDKEITKNEKQTVTVPEITDEATGKNFIKAVKNTFAAMKYPSTCFNSMGYMQQSEPSQMTLFIRDSVANFLDVEVLASAFNRDDLDFTPSGTSRVKIELMNDFGGVYPVDAFDNKLYPIYDIHGATTGQYSATEGGTNPVEVAKWVDPNENTYAILADDKFLLITRQLERMDNIYNPEGLYWNEFYHLWSQYGYTAFYNVVTFNKE